MWAGADRQAVGTRVDRRHAGRDDLGQGAGERHPDRSHLRHRTSRARSTTDGRSCGGGRETDGHGNQCFIQGTTGARLRGSRSRAAQARSGAGDAHVAPCVRPRLIADCAALYRAPPALAPPIRSSLIGFPSQRSWPTSPRWATCSAAASPNFGRRTSRRSEAGASSLASRSICRASGSRMSTRSSAGTPAALAGARQPPHPRPHVRAVAGGPAGLRSLNWRSAREHGLLAINAGSDVIRLLPPLTIQADHVAQAVHILGKALS